MSYLNHPYYTHQPFFIEVLKNTNGDVLECGCGEGSTAMIRSQLKGTSRKLVSIESDKAWLDKYIHLQNAEHDFYHVPADNNNTMETGMAWVRFVESTLADRQFDVVFIDPPFQQSLAVQTCQWLEDKGWLSPHAKIYVEVESTLKLEGMPENWSQLKSKVAGEVGYHLFERQG